MQASSVSDLLFTKLGQKGQKQKIISSNIANINTPNYKAKDIVFEDELSKTNDTQEPKLKLYTTHPNHISSFRDEVRASQNKAKIIQKAGLQEQNDGNNVSLDKELSDMAKNTTHFAAIQGSIKKDQSWFKSVIDASSKN